MDIYSFLRSRDIAEHCEKIGHIFSPLDMAVIIALSEKTMKEKHTAWREIISDYPDMPIHKSINFDARDSLHDYLRDLIEWEEQQMAEFYMPAENVIYRPNVWLGHGDGEGHDIGCYYTAEEAWDAINRAWDWIEDNVSYAKTDKQIIGEEHGKEAHFNSDGEMLYFNANKENLDMLEDIFIHIPLPFEKGDLVTFDGVNPQVLNNLPIWRRGRTSYEDFVAGKGGDGSDFVAHTYFISDNGYLYLDGDPFSAHNLQYFKGELKGQERFLKFLSRYIKKKDENLAWLISVFCKFKKEAEFDEVNSLFGGWYIPLDDEDTKKRENGNENDT